MSTGHSLFVSFNVLLSKPSMEVHFYTTYTDSYLTNFNISNLLFSLLHGSLLTNAVLAQIFSNRPSLLTPITPVRIANPSSPLMCSFKLLLTVFFLFQTVSK
jgi:hypothetical protein